MLLKIKYFFMILRYFKIVRLSIKSYKIFTLFLPPYAFGILTPIKWALCITAIIYVILKLPV